ncbi:hypothetical protein L501_1765 [Bordetella holmesii CDC-H719-BH]|nr:hypothetical protein L501_1765 [Bordetella holmesii CDC-H719-BH]
MIPALILENQGSSVTAIKHGSTLFRDEPKKGGVICIAPPCML